MKTLFKKHGWYPILVFIPVILFGFVLFAYAKQVSVDVLNPASKQINAEVTNIQAGTKIDITLPFTTNEKATIKTGLNFSENESRVLDNVLNNQALEAKDIKHFISSLNKLVRERKLSSDENKGLLTNSPIQTIKYLARKKVKENE